LQDINFWNQCTKSSTLKRIKGAQSSWLAPNGESVTLPLTVELLWHHEPTGILAFKATAEVALLKGEPRLIRMDVSSPVGLVPSMLQASFRWQSPLDVVTITVPALLKAGIDPYAFPLPTEGYPEAAIKINLNDKTRLTDEFLEGIVKAYLEGGRGYAKKIAVSRGVSERTVVSWIQKARERGILSKTRPGSHGGELISARKKTKDADAPKR
jgi:transposase-like protein